MARPLTRPNEDWWQRNGGLGWQREVDARRASQPHYGQQEAFLRSLFLALPPMRALDFGCGYGRHLDYLREVPGLEIHGCDMSPTMLEGAAAYLADPAFVRDRVHRIQPRARLPWPDGYFEVVFTSEVLIHVDSADLETLLPELRRVARRLVVHIENRPVTGSRRENDEHSGCWLHDFREHYRRLFDLELEVLPDVIDRQCLYLAGNPGDLLVAKVAGVARANHQVSRLEAALSAERAQSRALQERVTELSRAAAAAAATPAPNPTPTGPWNLLQQAGGRLFARRAPPTQPPPPVPPPENDETPPHEVDLSFAGVATRSSRATPTAFVSEQPRTVAVCHPAWRGIRAAAYGQLEHVLEVPGIVSEQHAERLVRFLQDSGTKRVVINGYPPNIHQLPEALARLAPDIRTYFVYHGAPAAAAHEMHLLQRMLDLSRERKVAKVGLVKDGLAEFFRQQGYRAEPVMNIARMPLLPPRPAPTTSVDIGVFVPAVSHKNLDTQVMAGLMVPGGTVHLCQLPPLPFLRRDDPRLRIHGILPHAQFMALLSRMHASLCVSLVECYPMTVLESFFSGVLCLTSHTSVIFDRSEELHAALVVTAHDSPAAIARKLMAALERREELVHKAQRYLVELNGVAERRFAEFLET
jgi:SAM-dependent methyltransferase